MSGDESAVAAHRPGGVGYTEWPARSHLHRQNAETDARNAQRLPVRHLTAEEIAGIAAGLVAREASRPTHAKGKVRGPTMAPWKGETTSGKLTSVARIRRR